MTRFAFALILLAGCNPDFKNPYLDPVGLKPEDIDPKAPPSENEVKSRILHDVRHTLNLTSNLDMGSKKMPAEIRYEKSKIVRADGTSMMKVTLKEDPPEREGAVRETAFYDVELRRYFYHYEGGTPMQDVWFGPNDLVFWRKPIPGFDE